MTDTPTEKPELIVPEEPKVWAITIADPEGKQCVMNLDPLLVDRAVVGRTEIIMSTVREMLERLLDA